MLAAIPASAHHSFFAEFDADKHVTIAGTITKIEWENPHARFYMDVKDESGAVTSWEFQMGSLNVLVRGGWSKNTLKIGDTVTVNGYPAKDGSRLANARIVTLSDGRKLNGGSSYTGGQSQ
jgi:V8-like Glu-specific endopeptidase